MLEVMIRDVIYDSTERKALEKIELTAAAGELVCICGKNGAGKSTLLNCIAGIIPHVIRASGQCSVTLDGEAVESADLEYVSESSCNSLFYFDVKAQLCHINDREREKILDDFGLLPKLRCGIGELSMGEKKIVTLLAALKTERRLCILDEPTVFLDDEKIEKLMRLIGREKAGKHILLISHDRRCMEAADSNYEIRDGKLYSCRLQEDSEKDGGERKETKAGESAALPVLLHIPALTIRHPNGVLCFDAYPLTLYEGEIVGICGGNGSGKTTLMNYLLKNIRLLYKKGYSKRKLTGMGMLQDFHKQFFACSAAGELSLGRSVTGNELCEEMLKDMGLWQCREESPHFLSDGQKRMLLLGALMLEEADLLILDEPFDNLDSVRTEQAKTMIRKFHSQRETIVILDQNMEIYEDLTDRIIRL